ncbi:MAG: ATP-dependent old family endonuclease [Parcubacteria group bacterium Gr01-1014_13]|nr:MAG: ATP-dependent old family endonuclease [Parcubacteria group bacterium Gr01-1014_13]
MIKKIKIKKSHKTIQKDFELDLEKTTVITGKNNSGKTNFIQAVNAKKDVEFTNAEFLDEKDKLIIPITIYIAAENINPSDNESNSSAKKSSLIQNLAELFSNLGIKFILEEQPKIIQEIKTLIDKADENLKEFSGKNDHGIKIKFNEGELDPATIAQALIKKIIGDENGEEVDLDDLGQGTQRIIVASILKAYVDILIERNKHSQEPILILFEEPEIYLHPELKRTLNITLKKIAEQDNHQVIITTHDPYFAYTNLNGENSVVYSFLKTAEYTEKTEPGIIFGIEDELLHIHLFEKMIQILKKSGKVKSFILDPGKELDIYIKGYCGKELRANTWYKEKKGIEDKLSLPLHIRHLIHHPGGKDKFTDIDLEKSIEILNLILSKAS